MTLVSILRKLFPSVLVNVKKELEMEIVIEYNEKLRAYEEEMYYSQQAEEHYAQEEMSDEDIDASYYAMMDERVDVSEYNWKLELEEQMAEVLVEFPCHPGDRIHLHSLGGHYLVEKIDEESITVSCNKWFYNKNKRRKVPISDYRCHAGGRFSKN